MPKIIFCPTPIPRPPFPPPTPVTGPLTFTAKQNGCRIGYIYFSEAYAVQDAGLNIEYSIDGGQTWLPYTMSTDEAGAQMIDLDNGETVMFRGNNANLAYYLEDDEDYQATKFVIEGQIAASGDVSSLLNGIGGVLNAPIYCYSHMFYDCTSLTQAPALPATTLAHSCYFNMFYGCTSLTQAPALPATTLANSCYSNMFNGCTSLTQAPALPATTLANSCYEFMFNGCTSLTQAPALPATTLANSCYSNMFNGCTLLSHIEALFTTTPGTSYTDSWVNGVAQNGTFVKSSEATWNVIGVNGIPTGWTVTTN